MKFIYFGHSRMLYDTENEKKALDIIRKSFPNYRILNPNKQKHQNNCNEYNNGVSGTEMVYFLNLTKICEFGIFIVYDKNKWSPGSYTEANYMIKCGKDVFLLDIETEIFEKISEVKNTFSFDEEKDKLIRCGRNILAGENG